MKPLILVSGSSSGLGKYLTQEFNALGLNRENSRTIISNLKNACVDCIIHCAATASHGETLDEEQAMLSSNVDLTRTLLSIVHKKFIFISSVDVYPLDSSREESQRISSENARNFYGKTKLLAEHLVLMYGNSSLVLRPSSLLGAAMKKNSVLRILIAPDKVGTKVFLSPQSRFNFVSYSLIKGFVSVGIKQNLRGIFNLSSSSDIALQEIASMFSKSVEYGTYNYNLGNIPNQKAVAFLPALDVSSRDLLLNFH